LYKYADLIDWNSVAFYLNGSNDFKLW
jgi:hypothetical protein